jgi:hypothetical protein
VFIVLNYPPTLLLKYCPDACGAARNTRTYAREKIAPSCKWMRLPGRSSAWRTPTWILESPLQGRTGSHRRALCLRGRGSKRYKLSSSWTCFVRLSSLL